MRERLKAPPAPEIVKYMISSRLFGGAEVTFPLMSRINQAHVLMLTEQGILSRETGVALLGCLSRMHSAGVKSIVLDAAREDLYYNIEAAVIAELGPEVGGQIHTGRSRNDMSAAVQRMKTRARALDMTTRAINLQERLLGAAEANADTVMTGYTHMQPGQPVTVGHYLAGVAQALQRDTSRMLESWTRINVSPIGVGGLATSGYPIDRHRMAALLGFEGVVENSFDAVGSRDYIADLIFSFAMAAITVSRFCSDLHVWCTHEFGYIDIDDSIAGTSSIMPQKKNPSPIEHLKAKASHQIGALMTILSAQKTTPFTHGREMGMESVLPLDDACYQIEATFGLCDAVVRGLVFQKDRMLDAARSNYCTLTELADTMVRRAGISFRSAHEVVAMIAREAHERHLPGSHAITVSMVEAAAEKLLGKRLGLTQADLSSALDPTFNVRQRKVIGGPDPDTVRESIARMRSILDEQSKLLTQRNDHLLAADALLNSAVAAAIR